MPTEKLTVEIVGEEDLRRKVEALRWAVGPGRLDQLLMRGASVIRDDARSRLPGELASAIEAHSDRAAKRAGQAVVNVGPVKQHWALRFREFGAGPHVITVKRKSGKQALAGALEHPVRGTVTHPGQPAQPFLRPALDEKGAEATARIAKAIDKEFKKVCGG